MAPGDLQGSRYPPQSPRDTVRVVVRREDEMRHDIADVPEGTGAGLGPGVLWQGGKILLQPLKLCLEDFDTFYLCGHSFSPLRLPVVPRAAFPSVSEQKP